MAMECKDCGEETHRIEGLCFDRDGMRNARFCNECKVVYAVYSHGMEKVYVLQDRYAGKAKNRIVGLLSQALRELRAEELPQAPEAVKETEKEEETG